MTFWDWFALGYVVVGLLMAAFVHHTIFGGFDRFSEKLAAEHPDSADAQECAQEMRDMRTMREDPRHRLRLIVVCGVMYVAVTFAWPAVVALLAVVFMAQHRKSRADRQ